MPLGVLCVFDTKPHQGLALGTYGALVSLADEAMARLDRAARPGAVASVAASVACGSHLAA